MGKGQRNCRDQQCERSKMGEGRRRGEERREEVVPVWGDRKWVFRTQRERSALAKEMNISQGSKDARGPWMLPFSNDNSMISILQSLFNEWKPETQRGQITLINHLCTCLWAWDAGLYLFALALPTVWSFETVERMLTSWQVRKWKDEELKFWMMKYKHNSLFWATIFYF